MGETGAAGATGAAGVGAACRTTCGACCGELIKSFCLLYDPPKKISVVKKIERLIRRPVIRTAEETLISSLIS